MAVARTGSGILTLSGANNYSGGTYISGGTLRINNANAIGTGTLTISGGTLDNTKGTAFTLATNNPINLLGGFTYAGTNDLNLGTGAVTLSVANPTINVNAGTLTIGGAITGTSLLKSNDGTLALLAASPSFSGTVDLRRGTLAVGASNALGTCIINLDQGILQAAVPLTGANKLMNDMQLTNGVASFYNAYTAFISEISGSNAIEFGGTLTKSGTGNNSLFVYNSGGTTFSGNVYISEAAGNARTLTINASGPTTISGVIANFNGVATVNSGLQVTGNNTLTLSGANTYTGGTALSGATTVLDYSTQDNSKLADAQALTVNGGATLRLSGGTHTEIVSATTLSTGGALNVARSSGTARLRMNAITRNTASTLNVSTDPTNPIADTDTNNVANGIMGGWATANGTDWAVSVNSGAADTPITALGSYQTGPDTTPWATTDNVSITGNTALSASRDIYTLKVGTTTTGQALNIGASQSLQLDSGGLLLTGSNDYTINNGTLQGSTAAASELIMHQFMSGT